MYGGIFFLSFFLASGFFGFGGFRVGGGGGGGEQFWDMREGV